MSTFRRSTTRLSVPFLSRLEVGSLLIYPSTDITPAGANAKAFIRYSIKEDKTVPTPGGPRGAIQHVASRVAEYVVGGGVFETLLGRGGILVPIPRHALLRPGDLWPALRICEELGRVGIGQGVEPCLERMTAVRRSSTARPGERPDMREHYNSLLVTPLLTAPTRLILVDDVVTRGATLIAAGSRLREQFADAQLVAFACARIVRDITLPTAADMLAPKVETISFDERFDLLQRG